MYMLQEITKSHVLPSRSCILVGQSFFGGGHFASTMSSHNFLFYVKIVCNQYESGHALFCEFTSCTGIFNRGKEMLDYICASGGNSQIHGYLIHSIQFADSDTTATFWQFQGTIVTQLCLLRDLQVVVAIVLTDHDDQWVKSFVTYLKSKGQKTSQTDISFLEQCNTIAGACHIIISVHSSCASTAESLVLKEPLPTPPRPIDLSLWEPFNRPEHLDSLAKDDINSCHQDI
jgi:hypothetical protein